MLRDSQLYEEWRWEWVDIFVMLSTAAPKSLSQYSWVQLAKVYVLSWVVVAFCPNVYHLYEPTFPSFGREANFCITLHEVEIVVHWGRIALRKTGDWSHPAGTGALGEDLVPQKNRVQIPTPQKVGELGELKSIIYTQPNLLHWFVVRFILIPWVPCKKGTIKWR